MNTTTYMVVSKTPTCLHDQVSSIRVIVQHVRGLYRRAYISKRWLLNMPYELLHVTTYLTITCVIDVFG